MAKNFEFKVVALDRYTKVFRDLNDKASKSVRPLSSIGRQVGALGREMHLDKAAKGIQRLTEGAVELGERLGVSFGPLAALAEAGAAGGVLAGIGVIGGALAALAARAGNLGYEVGRTSKLIGVSAEDLQRLRGAAKLAGVTTEDLTGSLAALGTTLQDAANGRNNDALALLNKLGIEIHYTKDGVVDVRQAFTDLSRAVSRVDNPYIQAMIAGGFGLDKSLPLLRQGPEAVDKLGQKAEELGLIQGPKALEWSEKFGDSLNRMKGAIGGVANSLGDELLPATTRMMNTTTDWLSGKGKSAGGKFQGPLDALLGPVRWVWDLGMAASGAPEGTTPEQRRASGRVTDASGNPAPLTAAGRSGPIDPEVMNAARYVNGPLSLEQQQQIFDESKAQRVEVHVHIPNAPPGTKVTATGPSGFIPTRVSYSMGSDGP